MQSFIYYIYLSFFPVNKLGTNYGILQCFLVAFFFQVKPLRVINSWCFKIINDYFPATDYVRFSQCILKLIPRPKWKFSSNQKMLSTQHLKQLFWGGIIFNNGHFLIQFYHCKIAGVSLGDFTKWKKVINITRYISDSQPILKSIE